MMTRLQRWWRARQAMTVVLDIDLRMKCRSWPRGKRRKFWRMFFRHPVIALDSYGEQLFGKEFTARIARKRVDP